MDEFRQQDLNGARFDQVSLKQAVFHDVSLENALFDNVSLRGARIRGALVVDVAINGMIDNLRVNGVDVVPLIDAELNRRYPDRIKMRPADADGFREAWAILERLWGETIARAQALPPASLHERVDGEWSFVETLRHLVFATDAWVRRTVLGDPAPWHPLDLPHDEMPDIPSVPRDRAVRPALDEVLALRADRMATVRDLIGGITDERLNEQTTPVTEPGYPESRSFPVRECLSVILDEEWEHRLYAERDLAELEKTVGGVS
ncbi:pentapeptide repeat protein [Kribbella antiqua]|uniref:Pentapeptide repeat protein n=1 Tax=Kribbella antiqua TaxID=2512217 RepID=A0A4R2J299_9ACTN|nr:DinB family protein [Kribbella antiqua]TCO51066.1 pentapeptide repeat protein [Kribbella antiqua]